LAVHGPCHNGAARKLAPAHTGAVRKLASAQWAPPAAGRRTGAPSVGRPLVVRQCRETRRPGQHPLLRVHPSPESSL